MGAGSVRGTRGPAARGPRPLIWHWLLIDLIIMGLGGWELYALRRDKAGKPKPGDTDE
jgi:hypothetical protein